MKEIGIIYGGQSTEHDASIASYEHLLEVIDHSMFEIKFVIFIDRNGVPLYNNSSMSMGELIDFLITNHSVFIISLLHGNEGEDGSWQGIADICNLNGYFESVEASSLTMNKYLQSMIVENIFKNKLLIPRTFIARKSIDKNTLLDKISQLSTDYIIVKPNAMGASHLTEKFSSNDIEGIYNLVIKIHKYDPCAIVQEYITGNEYTCGSLVINKNPFILPVIFATTNSGYLGHDEKHKHGLVKVEFVDNNISRLIGEYSKELMELFGIKGMCRFDFLISGENIYYLEANSIPGLSKGSAFPMMLKKAGLTLNNLISYLMESFESQDKRKKYLPYNID